MLHSLKFFPFFALISLFTENLQAQLVWPSETGYYLYFHDLSAEKQHSPSATWPKDIKELCRDTNNFENSLIQELSNDFCSRHKNPPFFNLSTTVESRSLNRKYPLGDSLDNFGNRNGSTLALGVNPETGRAWENLPPLIRLDLQHSFSKNTFFRFQIGLKKAIDAWHDDALGLNIPRSSDEVDINGPYLGYFSWHIPGMSAIVGRFPIHWSPSLRFGIGLSSSVPYHDGFMWSLKSKAVQFHFLASSISPWLSGTPDSMGGDYPIGSEEYLQRHPSFNESAGRDYNSRHHLFTSPFRTLFAHRLEGRIGFVEAGLMELVMVGGKAPGLRDANPYIFYHNNYSHGYTNTSINLDLKLKPVRSFALFGEMFLDDIKEADDGGMPTMLGWMAGFSHAIDAWHPALLHELHIIRTDPTVYNDYLPYLRMSSRNVLKSNYIPIGSRPFIDTYVIDYPFGYFRGPDAFDIWYDVTVLFSTKISLQVNFGILEHGENYASSVFTIKETSGPSGIVEEEKRAGAEIRYQPSPHISMSAGYGLQQYDNYQHQPGETAFHQQVFGGVGWSWK